MNVAEWGDGIFGIQAAAERYFDKAANDLGPDESSRLASVLPNPILFAANGNSKYIEERSSRIYQIMVRRGIVVPEYDDVMSKTDKEIEETLEEKQPASNTEKTEPSSPPSDETSSL